MNTIDRTFIKDAARQVIEAIDNEKTDIDLNGVADYFVRSLNAYNSNRAAKRVKELADDTTKNVIGEDYLD